MLVSSADWARAGTAQTRNANSTIKGSDAFWEYDITTTLSIFGSTWDREGEMAASAPILVNRVWIARYFPFEVDAQNSYTQKKFFLTVVIRSAVFIFTG
jgi:hypothetical protein